MTTATLPSGTGIVSTYTHDDADRLTGISHVKGGSTTIASVAYTLDDVGNRTQRVDQQGTHTYSYDDLYRLTSVVYPGPSTTSYAFDAFGNRTSMTVAGNTTSYAYDDNDRITSVTPPSPASVINYTWDDNGDLTARGSDSFSWDYEDRMVSATVNSVTTTFAYRGDGLRDSRSVSGGASTTFTWDIASGLPVVLDDGNQYVYGAGLTAMKQSGSWYYYLADGLGSTMAVVNASGVVQNSYTYDVYGTPTKTGSLANEFDVAGQQTDGTGLQYLRARYMDPSTGTFLSRDPLAVNPQWLDSLYGYVEDSPANYVDPSGLCFRGLWCPDVKKGAHQTVIAACLVSFLCPAATLGNMVCQILQGCGGAGEIISVGQLIGEYRINGEQRDITLSKHAVDAMDDLEIGSRSVMNVIKHNREFRYWENGQWQSGFWDGNRTLVTIADDGVVTNVQRFGTKEEMARYVKTSRSEYHSGGTRTNVLSVL